MEEDAGTSDSDLIMFEWAVDNDCAEGVFCVGFEVVFCMGFDRVCDTMSLIVGCRDCTVGVAPAVGVSAVFCFLRAEAVPSGFDTRGLRGLFSFGFSSPFALVAASGSFFLRGFLTFSVLGVVVFLAVGSVVEVDEAEPLGIFANIKGRELTTMVSATPRLPLVCGDGTGERDESELSSGTLLSIIVESQQYK